MHRTLSLVAYLLSHLLFSNFHPFPAKLMPALLHCATDDIIPIPATSGVLAENSITLRWGLTNNNQNQALFPEMWAGFRALSRQVDVPKKGEEQEAMCALGRGTRHC